MINTTKAVFFVRLHRTSDDLGTYYVTYSEGKEIPLFLGETPKTPFAVRRKHILLDYDFKDDGVNLEWSFYTINEDAIAAKKKENPNQEISRVRLFGFIQDLKQQATVKWNNYRLKLVFTQSWGYLDIFFFDESTD